MIVPCEASNWKMKREGLGLGNLRLRLVMRLGHDRLVAASASFFRAALHPGPNRTKPQTLSQCIGHMLTADTTPHSAHIQKKCFFKNILKI